MTAIAGMAWALYATPAAATPIRSIPNLQSVVVHERTGGTEPFANLFGVGSTEIENRIPVLGAANRDFLGTIVEFYDLYYSDADGTPNIDGMFLTIDAIFDSPSGGGFNVAEVELVYQDTSTELANTFTRVNALGNGTGASTASNAIDGDLLTHTNLGTSLYQNNRLSMTFGFASSIPEPASIWMVVLATMGLFARRDRR